MHGRVVHDDLIRSLGEAGSVIDRSHRHDARRRIADTALAVARDEADGSRRRGRIFAGAHIRDAAGERGRYGGRGCERVEVDEEARVVRPAEGREGADGFSAESDEVIRGQIAGHDADLPGAEV